MSIENTLIKFASKIIDASNKKNVKIATVESCTGGLISGFLTEIPGASKSFIGGIVAYSNELKEKLVYIPKNIIENYGAVSKECAISLAKGGHLVTKADLVISITGIAGPSGGTPIKPVGTTYFSIYFKEKIFWAHKKFDGSRKNNRLQACLTALQALLSALENDIPQGFEEVIK